MNIRDFPEIDVISTPVFTPEWYRRARAIWERRYPDAAAANAPTWDALIAYAERAESVSGAYRQANVETQSLLRDAVQP